MNKGEKTVSGSYSIANEMNSIRIAMQADPFFGWTWHCNLASCLQDEGVDHRKANLAAARFMKSAFGYDSTETKWFKEFKEIWKGIDEAAKAEESGAKA